MAKMTIRKTTLAIAAVVAMAFTGNAAKADNYQFDYTLTSILNGQEVTMVMGVSDLGIVGNNGFEEYSIDALYGTGNYANQIQLLTPAQAANILSNTPTYNFGTDNILYINSTRTQFALDDAGFSFSSGQGQYSNVYFDDFTPSSSNTLTGDYVQSFDLLGTNGQPIFTADAQIVAFDIKQVPTPGSLALIGTGLLALGLVSLRKKLV